MSFAKKVYFLYNEERAMRFEFDPKKSESDKRKHGIDFVEAQALWFGSVFEFPLKTTIEPRWGVIGLIEGVFWTAIITQRNNQIRIISVRRSRHEEKAIYKKRAQSHQGRRPRR
jgi:hypothetical protein